MKIPPDLGEPVQGHARFRDPGESRFRGVEMAGDAPLDPPVSPP
jgi:hypothetical protein